MKEIPKDILRKLLFIRIGKGDGPQVEDTIMWGADPDWRTKKGTPAIVRAVRGINASATVAAVLLRQGADASALDATGLSALDHVRRRLLKYEGKPRKPVVRSKSLSPGGELILDEKEWEHLEKARADKAFGEEYVTMYLEERRKAAERVHDPRGELEKMLALLESAARGDAKSG
jgi:hypothetical protein